MYSLALSVSVATLLNIMGRLVGTAALDAGGDVRLKFHSIDVCVTNVARPRESAQRQRRREPSRRAASRSTVRRLRMTTAVERHQAESLELNQQQRSSLGGVRFGSRGSRVARR